MSTLQSIPSCGLPVFPEAEVVVIDSLESTQPFGANHSNGFVRPVRMSPEVFEHGLTDVLSQTDEQLKAFAARCGAVVVPHTWGLIEARDARLMRFLGDEMGTRLQHEEVPHGMALAARVERILKPKRLGRRIGRTVTQEAVQYGAIANTSGTIRLADMRSAQFSVGILPSLGPEKRIVLHDIEPFVSET